MPRSFLRSKWTLGCATLGLSALAATYAVAAPKDPEARAVRRETRVEAAGRAILEIPMVDEFPTGRDAFVPRGQTIARSNRDARDSRHAERRDGRDEVDLAATVRRRGGEVGPSVSPIPEPSSVILVAAGAALVAYVSRRKLA